MDKDLSNGIFRCLSNIYVTSLTISMLKKLAKELERGNTCISIRLWENLTTQDFDMDNVGLSQHYQSI